MYFFFLLKEMNAGRLFTLFILGITTLASGSVLRNDENIDYDVPDYIHGGDKSLDLEYVTAPTNETNINDELITTSITFTEDTTMSHSGPWTTTTNIISDLDDSYLNSCNCPPQFLLFVYDYTMEC